MEFLKDGMNDFDFLNDTLMGPNCLKLLQEAVGGMSFERGSLVLDLGCGKGLTSMYLAETYGVTVFASDLWIEPTENLERFKRFGLEKSAYPLKTEAHELPYADGFFDAAVSVDSYHYYGAKEGYLQDHLVPLLKPGAPILVVVPGLLAEFNAGIPDQLTPYWQEDMHFHSCVWWRALWERSGAVEDISCSELSIHAEAWKDWLQCDNEHAQRDIAMMEAEAGQFFSSIRIAARAK